MSEQLGKIERPEAARFRRGKKLYLVPLIYSSEDAPDEYKEKHCRYWHQVAEQLQNLASKVGNVKRVYHESIFQAGDDGIQAAKRLNPGSYQIAKDQCDRSATFEPLEEQALLEEVMDWQRCLMIGFVSDKVEREVLEFYLEAGKKRNESVAKKIGETLRDNEAGLLFIREGHTVQFPADIEVFSVFPPGLDEIHRWHRDQARLETENLAEQQTEAKAEGRAEGVKKKTRKRAKRKPEE